MAKKIRVLIAEDHMVVREGLRVLLSTEPDVEIAGEADNGRTAVQMTRKLQPDVVLMDVMMPEVNGLDATQRITRSSPRCRVLVLSAYKDDQSVQRLVAAGAAGYLTKHSVASELLQAIREVSQGNSFFSAVIAERLLQQNRLAFLAGREVDQAGQLSAREQEVLQLVSEGFGNKQVAAELNISIKTVEKHRQSVMAKLGIHDTAGLTRYALAQPQRPAPGRAASGPV